ncbi:MAG: VOC family protein [Anaerolineae bacterium]|nr:VOC family protein [Anaerolineae bacterium]
MHIEHIAIWTRDLERLRAFYETYFGATAGPKYTNPAKGFASYFLTFPAPGARLELMTRTDVGSEARDKIGPEVGYAHLALATGSETQVDTLTQRLQRDGYRLLSGPRRTGDGYYESVFLDPDGNQIEITA